MFESLEHRTPRSSRRRWIGFVVVAGIVNAGAIAGAVLLVSMRTPPPEEEVIPISFAPRPTAEPVEAAAEPPPAPPPETPRPTKSASRGGRRLRKALEAPRRLPASGPLDVDPDRPPGSDQAGGGGTGLAGPEGASVAASVPPRVPDSRQVRPVRWSEVTTPPIPDAGNPEPVYPEEARLAGLEGQVDLKVEISEGGLVVPLKVFRGEEPFVSAVEAVLGDWKFRPALLEGREVAVYRVLRFRFRLND